MILFPIPRANQREQLGLKSSHYLLPFKGSDIWYAYELSWLDEQGKPQVALGRMTVPCESPYLIESKSLKLYFNSHTEVVYKSPEVFVDRVQRDLSEAAQADVVFDLLMPENFDQCTFIDLPGECIDGLAVETDVYEVEPAFLRLDAKNAPSLRGRQAEAIHSESGLLRIDDARNDNLQVTLHSHLLKSNCPATGWPDWGSVVIDYEGPALDKANLLKYIVSYRNHREFHEHCIERIFLDILHATDATKLTVYARYTRRGGIDINPIRTTESTLPDFAWTRTARA